jgi:hypothetical protein
MKFTKTITYGWDSDEQFFIEEVVRNAETDEVLGGTRRMNISRDAMAFVLTAINEGYTRFCQVGKYTEVL